MTRASQGVLIVSTLVGSWLGMQAVHEFGHVAGAWLTGARVVRVVLHPLTISRTDVVDDAHPLIVVWAGPLVGAVVPFGLWGLAALRHWRGAFVGRFFAGFCLLANGLYLGIGSFVRVGDCGELLRLGAPAWQLWLFGVATAPLGLWLWHGEGPHFGMGAAGGRVDPLAATGTCVACLALLTLGLIVGRG